MSLLIYASQFSTIRTLSTSHSKCNKCFMTLLSNLVYVSSVCYRAVGTGSCGVCVWGGRDEIVEDKPLKLGFFDKATKFV